MEASTGLAGVLPPPSHNPTVRMAGGEVSLIKRLEAIGLQAPGLQKS